MVTKNESLQGLVSRSHGIPPLIDLVSKGGLATQAAAARTLWHMAGNPDIGQQIANAGGMHAAREPQEEAGGGKI